ncbi:D-3-phosphoglycerate dehydrogenase [Lacunisphaera limnophila]|uniref:D-3-phosphoglycerate dehydrogenase n=1 Tax=Lacunisphaera limnophila TaxID=1838286 RepID=A0A1D8ATI6_9BACT|nr:NAD(P)-dependent oxidoreductase [Lacunisphaera limnophila]AOS44203.1 D-3-phosphoglycerate dehydrogenase [Lacunisphaera limnophila]
MPRPVAILASLTAEELRDFLPEPLLGQARAVTPRFTVWDPTGQSAADFASALAAADPEVLLACWKTPPLPPVLPPRLRYVCYLCGSVRRLVRRDQLEAGLVVTNWGGSISRVVAEWALFHILACLRRAPHWTIAMHTEGAWKNGGTETASLFGRRIGLHGYGQIARELVQLLRPFHVTITSFAPDVTPEVEAAHGIRRAASLESLFAENDIIVELAPLNPSTAGLVQEKHLRLIRPGGVFVNVGRGAVVDEAALLRVAQEGRIMVGLDVYGVEPLPADSPFRGLRNVSLTPHIAGPTTDRRCDAGAFAVENLVAYAEDRPLRAVITPTVYDTST